MISKTVLSTAVTLALSAGFVSAQSNAADDVLTSNISEDYTIEKDVSEMVFNITPGKVEPTGAHKKLYAFGNENIGSTMVVKVLSSDITVINKTNTNEDPVDGRGAVLGGAKFIGSGGKATLISELDVLKDFHNEISEFNDLTLTSRTANAIYFGGASSTAKLSAKHITLNGKKNAIYIDEAATGTSANNVTIDGFDSLVMNAETRYAVRNVGIAKQAIALTGNENSTITLTGARGAIDTGYVTNGQLIGNGSVSVTAGKVTLETTGIASDDIADKKKNSDFGIVHVQGGSVTINSDELTIRPADSATDWDANAFKLTKGELKINGTDGKSPAVMNVQGAIDASGEAKAELNFTGAQSSVSYTHLTLPTKPLV